MILAAEGLSYGAQAFFYGAAFVIFVVAAVLAAIPRNVVIALIAAGLALFTFVAFWNTLTLA